MSPARAQASSFAAALVLVLGLVAPTRGWAQAATTTCVTVATDRGDAEGLLRLVRSELDRHSSHRSVDPAREACATHLRIEIIDVREGRFLTARMSESVPHRERIEGNDARALEAALERALVIVLHNDPRRLVGPERDHWLARQGTALRRRGQTLLGAELAQTTAYVDGRFDFLPGVALVARREVDDWHLGVRLSAAWDPGAGVADHARLTLTAGGAVEVEHFFDGLADTSLFAGGGVGLDVQRFTGPARYLEPGDTGAATEVVVALAGRIGIELFRTADARVRLFGQVALPVMPSSDDDAGVVDAWVPTATLGAGVVY